MINPADHVGLVYAVAKKYASKDVEIDELVSVGTLGLIRATEKFEPERELQFSTYARWWIEASIKHFFRRNRTVPVSDKVFYAMKRDGRLPRASSLDAPVAKDGNDRTLTLHDLLVDEGALNAFDEAVASERRGAVRKAMRSLPPRTRQMVRLRFEEDATLGEIAEVYGVSRERVRQILERALDLLYVELSFLESV